MPQPTDERTLAMLRTVEATIASREREANEHRPENAPDFNTLHFARTDEVGLSRILGDLLDPRGSHGQGARFLRLFLDRFWPGSGFDPSLARVTLEAPTRRIVNNSRRLDILISFPQGVLGIENKPWGAPDQPMQVRDYLCNLEKENRHHRLLYLSRRPGELPGAHSMGEAVPCCDDNPEQPEPLHASHYQAIERWLADCIGVAANDRVRGFLGDFAAFIHTDVSGMPDMSEQRAILDTVMASPSLVRAALSVQSLVEALKTRLLDSLHGQLAEHLKQGTTIPATWVLTEPENLRSDDAGITLLPAGALYGLRLGFDRNANGAWVGVCSVVPQPVALHERVCSCVALALGQKKTSPHWAWFAAFPNAFNWWDSIEAMTTLSDPGRDGMAAKVFREFERLYDDLERGNALNALFGRFDEL